MYNKSRALEISPTCLLTLKMYLSHEPDTLIKSVNYVRVLGNLQSRGRRPVASDDSAIERKKVDEVHRVTSRIIYRSEKYSLHKRDRTQVAGRLRRNVTG